MMSAPGTECLGRRILVIGDVNTGKTTLCKRWLHELCQQGLDTRIALLDLAPTIPPELALKRGIVGAGGELRAPEGSGVLDLRAHLEPPRLSSSSESEALEKAARNAQLIEALISRLEPQRDILFINDVTLFLQARSAASLIESAGFDRRATLVVNGYRGERLGGGALTRHETAEMSELEKAFAERGEVVMLTHRYDS
jgi:GTPase SAR1 family protein